MTRNARYVSIALLGAVLLGTPERAHQAPGGPEVAPPKAMGPQEVEVVAVVMDQATHQPTILLQGKRDRRSLAVKFRVDPEKKLRILVGRPSDHHGISTGSRLIGGSARSGKALEEPGYRRAPEFRIPLGEQEMPVIVEGGKFDEVAWPPALP